LDSIQQIVEFLEYFFILLDSSKLAESKKYNHQTLKLETTRVIRLSQKITL
jgi:hypothetical protein